MKLPKVIASEEIERLIKENQKLQQRLKDIEKIIEKHLTAEYEGVVAVMPEYNKIMKDIKKLISTGTVRYDSIKTQRGDGE